MVWLEVWVFFKKMRNEKEFKRMKERRRKNKEGEQNEKKKT